MRRLPAVARFALGLSLALLIAPLARAQTAQDRATARNAAEEADKKLSAKDYDGALELFTKADALVPAPTLKLQIGRVQIARGKLVEGQQSLLDAAHAPPQASEPPSWAKAREQAAKEAAEVKPRVPAMEIIVEPKDKPSRVMVDGEAVNPSSLGIPRATNPGQHTVRAEADGFQPAETTIVLREGDRTQVVLRLVPGGAVTAPPLLPPPGPTGLPARPADGSAPRPEVSTPPPAEDGHLHRGFFLRLAVGPAFHSSTLTSKVPGGEARYDASGTAGAIDFFVGGMVARGFAIAGDLGGHAFSDPSVKPQNSGTSITVKGTLTYARLGVVGVFYPIPTGGFHLFGGLGYGSAQFKITDDTFPQAAKDANGFTASGLAVSGGAGYEFWVGAKSSVGGLVRFDYASLSGKNDVAGVTGTTVTIDRSFSLFVPAILLNYTYN